MGAQPSGSNRNAPNWPRSPRVGESPVRSEFTYHVAHEPLAGSHFEAGTSLFLIEALLPLQNVLLILVSSSVGKALWDAATPIS